MKIDAMRAQREESTIELSPLRVRDGWDIGAEICERLDQTNIHLAALEQWVTRPGKLAGVFASLGAILAELRHQPNILAELRHRPKPATEQIFEPLLDRSRGWDGDALWRQNQELRERVEKAEADYTEVCKLHNAEIARANKAEARVRELGQERDSWRRTSEKLANKLDGAAAERDRALDCARRWRELCHPSDFRTVSEPAWFDRRDRLAAEEDSVK